MESQINLQSVESQINLQPTAKPFILTLSDHQLLELSELQWAFALDMSSSTGKDFSVVGRDLEISGSTEKKFSPISTYLDVECNFARSIQKNLKKKPHIIAWNDIAVLVPEIMNVCSPNGGTHPECVLKSENTKKILKKSQVLVLMTDGKINPENVRLFTNFLVKKYKHFRAIIGVLFGRITQGYSALQPYEINTSVLAGLGAMGNSCILFHNSYNTYVMNAWGAFYDIWKPVDIEKGTVWPGFGDPAVTTINPEDLNKIKIKIPKDSDMENKLIESNYIPMGQNCFFKRSKFLKSNPEWNEFMNLPWTRICLLFKTTCIYEDLLKWFLKQRKRFADEFFPDPIQNEIFDDIIDQIVNKKSKQNMNSYFEMRRKSHVSNYSTISYEEIKQIITDPKLLALYKFFDDMAKIIHHDFQNRYSENTYTAYTLSYSYYKNSDVFMDVDFNYPLKWLQDFKAHKNNFNSNNSNLFECSICFNEDIPFVILRRRIYMRDTPNKPLDYFYKEIVCGSCAQLFCNKGTDPVRVKCFAALPIVKLNDRKSIELFKQKFREIIIVGKEEGVEQRVQWIISELANNLPNELQNIVKQFC